MNASPPRRRLFSRFARDKKGVVGIIFALMLLPIAAMIGAAIDYRAAGQEQVKLRQATEAAALAVGRSYFKPLKSKEEREDPDQLMRNVFNSNYGSTPFKVSDTIVELKGLNDKTKEVNITASAKVATDFMKILGFNTISISADAKAASVFSTSDVQVHMVVDYSTSMVVPDDGSPSPLSSTPYDPPGGGCFFMCHDDGSTIRNAGKTPKLDDIQLAFGSDTGLIQRVSDAADGSEPAVTANFIGYDFDMSVIGINPYAGTKEAKEAVLFPYTVGLRGAQGGTDLNQSFQDVYDSITNTVNNTVIIGPVSENILKRIIIIVSDGAHSRSHKPYDPAVCNRLKDLGDVYTLHINTPISVYDNANVTARIPQNGVPGPLYARNDPNAWDLPTWEHGGNNPNNQRGYYSGTANGTLLMRNCASKPEWAFEAETGPQIFDAMKAMTDVIIAPEVRIIN